MDDRQRRMVYWSTITGSFVLLNVLSAAGLALFGWLTREDWGGSLRHLLLLQVPISQVSALFGVLRCRRLGLSLESNDTEVLTPRGPAAEASATGGAAAGQSRGCFGIAGALGTLLAAGIAAAVYFLPSKAGTEWAGYMMAGFVGLGSLACWLGVFTNARLVSIADDEGITRCSLMRSGVRKIPWEQVGRCAVHTNWDALGRRKGTTCVIYDHAGKETLRLDLAAVPEKERERFLEVVRAKHGTSARPELIAAEAPAGLGTELEATWAPDGRGTEPEAEMGPVPDGEPAQGARADGRERARGG